jgi:glycosidase
MKKAFLLAPVLAAMFAPFACAGGEDLVGNTNGTSVTTPPNTGGWTPGSGGGTASGSGSGANQQTTTDTTVDAGKDAAEEPSPPVCDDSLKRCDHDFTYADGGEQTVEIRGTFAPDGWTKGVPLAKVGGTWTATVQIPWDVDVQYKFVIDGKTWVPDPANPNQVDDGQGGKNSLLKGETCAWWSCAPPPVLGYDWSDAVLYFVFVDRFLDGNPANNGAPVAGVDKAANYQGGDYAGVLKKIQDGYFNDLGVNTLWLTVPMDNPEVQGLGTDGKEYSAYHGYWPQNLDKTEERFGSLAELKGLVDAAHKANLKVILDYAMNHVHSSSPVYQQHQGWFWPLDWGGKHCVCGQGCAWDGPDAKRCWFTDYLPDWDYTQEDARKFSVDNAIQWIKDTGIDGYRLDAVKHIEDSWLLDLRSRVTSDIEPTSQQHFYMVGETFTGDQNLIKYYVNSSMLDGQFDFPFRMKLASTVLMRHGTMQDLDGFVANNDIYGNGVMSTFIGNHDIPRAIHLAQDQPLWDNEWTDGKDRSWVNQPALPGGTSAFERLANAFTILFTLKGIPLVYYGDEVGMPGAGDPDNRRMMQWSSYSTGQQKLLAHVKKLGAIRAAHPALRRGTRSTLSVGTDTYAYKLALNGDTVYVLVNRGDGAANVGGLPAGSYTDLLTDSPESGPSPSVPARSSMILVAK